MQEENKVRQEYTTEFKEHIVKLRLSGRSISSLCKEYGLAKQTISNWISKYRETHLPEDIDPLEELQRLRKYNAELEKENLFLKKAAAFFAKQQMQ